MATMKRVIFVSILSLLVVSCAPKGPEAPAGGMTYRHDDVHHVSCWTVYTGGGGSVAISCLPDSEVTTP